MEVNDISRRSAKTVHRVRREYGERGMTRRMMPRGRRLVQPLFAFRSGGDVTVSHHQQREKKEPRAAAQTSSTEQRRRRDRPTCNLAAIPRVRVHSRDVTLPPSKKKRAAGRENLSLKDGARVIRRGAPWLMPLMRLTRLYSPVVVARPPRISRNETRDEVLRSTEGTND